MKLRLIALSGMVIFLAACGGGDGLPEVNSASFSDTQITLGDALTARVQPDSTSRFQEPIGPNPDLNNMTSMLDKVRASKSDSSWNLLVKDWQKYKTNSGFVSDSAANHMSILESWAELNSRLIKFSEVVRFADELESLLYKSAVPVLSKTLLKSVIYTHIDDQIFINLFGSSSVVHKHTTGGTIKIIQQTDYPAGNVVVLKFECSDTRFLDLFIRVPEWAINPTVNLGNVKYVAHAGEFCQISRKWDNGDEVNVSLKN